MKVDPVLVSKAQAAKLIAKDVPTINELIEQGKLPIAVVAGETLIPYRALLVLAGSARWRFEQIEA